MPPSPLCRYVSSLPAHSLLSCLPLLFLPSPTVNETGETECRCVCHLCACTRVSIRPCDRVHVSMCVYLFLCVCVCWQHVMKSREPMKLKSVCAAHNGFLAFFSLVIFVVCCVQVYVYHVHMCIGICMCLSVTVAVTLAVIITVVVSGCV